MKKPLVTITLDWTQIEHKLEFFKTNDISNLGKITQVQAVCFSDKDQVVLYYNDKEKYGCPGGHLEKDEQFEEALEREIYEEIAAKMLYCEPIGYLRSTNLQSGNVTYNLRYWAKVVLLDEPVNDPCDPHRERFVFTTEEAILKLNWGEMGQTLVKLAEKMFISKNNNN